MIDKDALQMIIGGFIIISLISHVTIWWIINRFTEKPLFKRKTGDVQFFDRSS